MQVRVHKNGLKTIAPELSRESLLQQLGEIAEQPIVKAALELAERKHRNQLRIGGGSVLEEHIYPVCSMVFERSRSLHGSDLECRLAAALCHDLVEDTDTSLGDIRALNSFVAELVEVLTETEKAPADYFRAIRESTDAQLIKVCDRLNNLHCAHKISDRDQLLLFCKETEEHVLPFARSLRIDDASEMERLLIELRKLALS